MKKHYLGLFLIALLIFAGCKKNDIETVSEKGEEIPVAALTFETTDIDGNEITMELLSEAKVIMLNFWEPWCGPCVSEMGDLEKLYEEYKDEGFVILGAFMTQGQDDEVKMVMENCKTTYPIIRATEDMTAYMTKYVPTTVFFDGSGKKLLEEPVIGAREYSDWEKMILDFLE